MSSCNRLSQASCTRCCNLAMVVAGSGERVSSNFIMSHTCSIGERSEDLACQGSCCTPRRAFCISAAVCGCVLSCWKSTSPSCRKNGSRHGVNKLCNVMGTVYFTLQKHQIWPWVVTEDLHTKMPDMDSGQMHAGSDAHQVYALHEYVLTCIQTESTLITEDNRAPFHSPVNSFTTTE